MKKIVKISAFAAIAVIAVFLAMAVYRTVNARKIINDRISNLPGFSFITGSGKEFSNADIRAGGNNLIINFFSPDCEHCQHMAEQYVKNAAKFRNIDLLMVTLADSAEVEKFRIDYHLDSLPGLVLLRDVKVEFPKIFGTSVVPSFFVYKNRLLVKKITGETKVENLLPNK